jgi:hypothetical protein
MTASDISIFDPDKVVSESHSADSPDSAIFSLVPKQVYLRPEAELAGVLHFA